MAAVSVKKAMQEVAAAQAEFNEFTHEMRSSSMLEQVARRSLLALKFLAQTQDLDDEQCR